MGPGPWVAVGGESPCFCTIRAGPAVVRSVRWSRSWRPCPSWAVASPRAHRPPTPSRPPTSKRPHQKGNTQPPPGQPEAAHQTPTTDRLHPPIPAPNQSAPCNQAHTPQQGHCTPYTPAPVLHIAPNGSGMVKSEKVLLERRTSVIRVRHLGMADIPDWV